MRLERERGRIQTRVCSAGTENQRWVKSAPPPSSASSSHPSVLIPGPEDAHWLLQAFGHVAWGSLPPAQSRRVAVHPWSGSGVASGQHLPSQLIALPGVFFLAQNCREEKERAQRRECHMTVANKQRRKTQLEKGDRRKRVCLPAFRGVRSLGTFSGKCRMGWPFCYWGRWWVRYGETWDLAANLLLALCDPGPVLLPVQGSAVPARKQGGRPDICISQL